MRIPVVTGLRPVHGPRARPTESRISQTRRTSVPAANCGASLFGMPSMRPRICRPSPYHFTLTSSAEISLPVLVSDSGFFGFAEKIPRARRPGEAGRPLVSGSLPPGLVVQRGTARLNIHQPPARRQYSALRRIADVLAGHRAMLGVSRVRYGHRFLVKHRRWLSRRCLVNRCTMAERPRVYMWQDAAKLQSLVVA
jgi:hypothetical protein